MINLERIKNKFKVDKSFKDLPKETKKVFIKRKIKDAGINGSTILFGLFTVAILIWMVVYIFTTGASTLTWDFITSDYTAESLTLAPEEGMIEAPGNLTFENSTNAEHFSSKWGVAFGDGKDNLQNNVVYVVHIEENSPFNDFVNPKGEKVALTSDYYCNYISISTDGMDFEQLNGSDLSAQEMAEELDKAEYIFGSNYQTRGEGIRGSLLTTLLLIAFSLLFSLPLGIGAAIYLGVYAKNGPITKGIRTLIDVTSGIPSIIFGLAGAIIFIPFVNAVSGTSGGNIFSGSLTMAIMLLPTIVKTTEESINVIPKSLTFTNGYASLAVHIYVILGGEAPRYQAACAIAIIILIVVLVLSLLVKLISLRLNRFKGAK